MPLVNLSQKPGFTKQTFVSKHLYSKNYVSKKFGPNKGKALFKKLMVIITTHLYSLKLKSYSEYYHSRNTTCCMRVSIKLIYIWQTVLWDCRSASHADSSLSATLLLVRTMHIHCSLIGQRHCIQNFNNALQQILRNSFKSAPLNYCSLFTSFSPFMSCCSHFSLNNKLSPRPG